MKQLNTLDKFLNKHSATIHISNNLSLLERKIFNFFMINAMNNEAENDLYTVNLIDLKKVLEYNKKDYLELKVAVDKLLTTKLQWNILDKDKKGKLVWDNASTFISSRSFSAAKGILRYSFSPELRELFLKPNIYAKLNLQIQNQFASKHSLVLWEFLMEHLCTGGNFKKTNWIEVDDYKILMGATEGKYKDFKEISRNLIKKPLKEVNAVSDLKAKEEFKKSGKNIVALRFEVKRKEPNLSFTNSLLDNASLNALQNTSKNAKFNPLYDEVLVFGTNILQNKIFNLNAKEIEIIIDHFKSLQKTQNFSQYDFENAVLSVKENLQKGAKVKNILAQIKAAIKEKWQSEEFKKKDKLEEKNEKVKILQEKLEKIIKKKANFIKKFNKYIFEIAKKEFDKLSPFFKEELMKNIKEKSSARLFDFNNENIPEEILEKATRLYIQKEMSQEKIESLFKKFEKENNFSHIEIDKEIQELEESIENLS